MSAGIKTTLLLSVLVLASLQLQAHWGILDGASSVTRDGNEIPCDATNNNKEVNVTVTAPQQEEEKLYVHDNRNIPQAEQCTNEQRSRISDQLGLTSGRVWSVYGCHDGVYLESFFEEESNIGSESFLGISVGCNKGVDAVRTARMGMMDESFDIPSYKNALGNLRIACSNFDKEQMDIKFPKRGGEMHCIEPMPNNVKAIKGAKEKAGLGSNFIVTQAAISSSNGMIKFPDGDAGTEHFGIDWCSKKGGNCVDTPMYSLDYYANHFISSKGPVNVLQIDVEGFDYDVLFGASAVLDRTYYLEVSFHTSPLGLRYFPLPAGFIR